MLFADDVALVTTSVEDMEEQLTKLSRESKQVGLTMHKDKTKYMTNFDTNIDIVIENHKLEKVENYKYLGQTLRMKDTSREEIMSRIKAGWRSFGMYKDILTDNNIAMSLRRRVYNQCILTTMTYGAETWTTTNELNNKLITTQRAMERKMVHLTIRDKVNHNKIREKTKVKDIIEKIKETKWRWAGHVLRVQDNRWTRRLTEWQPRTGKRKRGRQKKRWRDDITAHMGTATWTRVARERDKWKFYEEGFVQQMDEL